MKKLLAANKRLNTAVYAEGVLRAVVELRAGGLGTAILRELASSA